MKRTVLAGFAAAMMAFGAINSAVAGNAAPADPSHVVGQIMVKFRDHRAAADTLRQHGLSEGPGIGSTGAHLIKAPAGKELQLIEALNRNPATPSRTTWSLRPQLTSTSAASTPCKILDSPSPTPPAH